MTRREIDWADRGRRATVTIFMGALLVPGVAVAGSDHVRETVNVLVNNPSDWAAQSNRLRAGTPLWNNAVNSFSTLQFDMGTSSNPSFGVVGRDGWMFLGDAHKLNFSQALGRRQFSSDEISAWAATYAAEREWLESQGIEVLFVVGPAKWSVYPEQLPAWTEDVPPAQTIFDQMLSTHPELELIDLREGLIEASVDEETYPPLNSHWTRFGAYVGWEQLAEELNSRLPEANITVPAISGVSTRDAQDENEFLPMMGIQAPNPWTEPQLEQALPDIELMNPDGSASTVPGSTITELLDLPRTTQSPSAPNDLRAMVLRDSMSDSLSPYLQSSFQTVWQLGHYIDDSGRSPNLPAAVDLFKPDVVIIEMAERYFTVGLPDAQMWADANAYESAPQDNVRSWQAGGVDQPVEVEGNPRDTGRVQLTWTPGEAGTEIARLSLLADGPGAVTVTAQDGSVKTLRVAPGANVLFVELPAGTGAATIDVVPGSASSDITSVQIRTARG